jgi:hypothetical protein
MLNGSTLGQVDDMGEPVTDDTFLVMLNSYGDAVTCTLPQSPRSRGWKLMMNTADLDDPFGEKPIDGTLDVAARSVAVLCELSAAEAGQPETQRGEEKTDHAEAQAASNPAEVPEEEPVSEEPVPVAQ